MGNNGKVTKESEINTAFEEQEKQIQHLNELVEQAFTKFNLVLRSEKTDKEEEEEKESSVPIVGIIEGKTRMIRRVNSRLNDLIQLCEL